MGRELHDNAEVRAFTVGAESPRLVVTNAEMATFQGQQRGGLSVAEREQAVFANGFDFAQAGNIYGKADLLAYRLEQTEQVRIADKPKRESESERHNRVMREHYAAGEPVGNFAQRPGVKDAMSASPTFAHAMRDLDDCKWGKAIRIWRGHPTEITDYSAEYNLMELDSRDGARRQVEVFSHEAYHATHQDLDKLYGKNGPVTPQEFISIKMHQEAGAFLQEIKTNEQLHHSRPTPLYAGDDPNKHIEYMWIDKANPKAEPQKQDMNALLVGEHGKINEQASLQRIETFLRERPAAIKDGAGGFIRDSSGNYRMNDYVLHYRDAYGDYKEQFNNNRSHLIKMGYIAG